MRPFARVTLPCDNGTCVCGRDERTVRTIWAEAEHEGFRGKVAANPPGPNAHSKAMLSVTIPRIMGMRVPALLRESSMTPISDGDLSAVFSLAEFEPSPVSVSRSIRAAKQE